MSYFNIKKNFMLLTIMLVNEILFLIKDQTLTVNYKKFMVVIFIIALIVNLVRF